MKYKIKLEVGDVLLLTPKKLTKNPMTWVSQGIAYFMRQYLVSRKLVKEYNQFLKDNNLPANTIPTHTDLVIKEHPYIEIIGATAKGAVINKLEDVYSEYQLKRIIVMRLNRNISEVAKFKLYNNSLKWENTPYQFRNFIQQIIYIKRGKWFGFKNKLSDRKTYCIELTSKQLNEVFKDLIPDPYCINPVQFMMLRCFKIMGSLV